MSDTYKDFDNRLARIASNKARLRKGYVSRVGHDGLIVFRPRRARFSVSPRGLAMVVLGFVFFKSVIMAHLGAEVYNQRIAALNSGTLVEQAGGFLMYPDPATRWAAGKMRPYLR